MNFGIRFSIRCEGSEGPDRGPLAGAAAAAGGWKRPPAGFAAPPAGVDAENDGVKGEAAGFGDSAGLSAGFGENKPEKGFWAGGVCSFCSSG